MIKEDLRYDLLQRPQNNLKVVDLFCGGGIGACGTKLAGYDIVQAIDNNKYAVATYNKNIGEHAINIDIRLVEELPYHDIMISSPVCKSFSFAGNCKDVNDEKYGDLSYHFLRLLEKNKPKAFVFENVKGMVSKKHKTFFDDLVNRLRDIGYEISWKVVNTHNYGVPQLRERIFIVGVRNDIDLKFEFPLEIDDRLKTNLRYAIGDLPNPQMVLNSSKDVYVSEEKSVLENHIGYGIMNDEKEFINDIKAGENWKALSKEKQKAFMKGALNSGGGKTGFLRKVMFDKPSYTITSSMFCKSNAQIIDNHDKYIDGNFSSRYVSRNRQKQWNEPSFTIVSVGKQLPLYPEPSNYDIRNMDKYDCLPPRRFTVRECLRIQTVPDSYVIDSDIPLNKQYEIVGNGIPSLMLYKILINLEKVLLKKK